jgi:hypothetical protein
MRTIRMGTKMYEKKGRACTLSSMVHARGRGLRKKKENEKCG